PHSAGDRTAFADINADGLPDVLVTAPELYAGSHAVFLNKPNSISTTFDMPKSMGVQGVSGVDANVLRLSNPNVSALDYDSNGVVDLVHMPRAKKYSVFAPKPNGPSF